MCIVINRWKDFEPNEEYLKIVKNLTTVDKLLAYLKQFKPKAEKGWRDYWKTPWEFINNKDKPNDCEDFARFAVDVLVRIIKIIKARFIIQSGYDKARWGNKCKCHAICVFPYQGKFAAFSNNRLYTGLNNYEEAGKITFPDGLKFQQVRNSEGEVLETRRQWIGTF